jgi:hypothetical protein
MINNKIINKILFTTFVVRIVSYPDEPGAKKDGNPWKKKFVV